MIIPWQNLLVNEEIENISSLLTRRPALINWDMCSSFTFPPDERSVYCKRNQEMASIHMPSHQIVVKLKCHNTIFVGKNKKVTLK